MYQEHFSFSLEQESETKLVFYSKTASLLDFEILTTVKNTLVIL